MSTYERMISELKTVAVKTLPQKGRMYLYGSHARGDANEHSDWDILILLDKEKILSEDFNAVAYPLVEAGWKLDEVVSPQVYTFQEWEQMSFTPYYKNVEHDKVVIA